MRVLYDHQIFAWHNYGGVARYFYELLKAQPTDAELALKYSDNEYLLADNALRGTISPKLAVPRKSRLARVFGRRAHNAGENADVANLDHTVSRLCAGQHDVFHPTYYDPYFLEWVEDEPFVITVYDMIHELFPEHFSIDDSTSSRKKLLVNRAAHVIAISERTKQDLIDIYNVPQSKISVTYLGGSLESVDSSAASAMLPSRYVLLVGTRTGYKNSYFAIRSLARLLEADPHLNLVCAGGGAFKEAENRFFAELGIAGRIHYMPASDAHLALLYEKALAFVFPSLYEGFGIPIIEAFSRGCPVVASNTPALVEVGGDAAQYFDPKRAESLIHALQMILSDTNYREKLVKRGYIRAASFSWEKCATETKAVYRKTIATS